MPKISNNPILRDKVRHNMSDILAMSEYGSGYLIFRYYRQSEDYLSVQNIEKSDLMWHS